MLHEVLKALPPRPSEGRPPPAKRLDKHETYALFGQPVLGTAALWKETSSHIFTKRTVDAYEEEVSGFTKADVDLVRNLQRSGAVVSSVADG